MILSTLALYQQFIMESVTTVRILVVMAAVCRLLLPVATATAPKLTLTLAIITDIGVSRELSFIRREFDKAPRLVKDK